MKVIDLLAYKRRKRKGSWLMIVVPLLLYILIILGLAFGIHHKKEDTHVSNHVFHKVDDTHLYQEINRHT